jgi:type VI secretion system protein ImpK
MLSKVGHGAMPQRRLQKIAGVLLIRPRARARELLFSALRGGTQDCAAVTTDTTVTAHPMPFASSLALHRAIDYALRLHSAVERGANRDIAHEQAVLTNLALETPGGDQPGKCRGARYALVCWLDELFTCHSRWADAWNEGKLESTLYGGNDRAWEFWRQAQLADAEPTDDSLAAYYLCVALGFRGELRDQPERLAVWVEKTRSRVARGSTPASQATRVARRTRPALRLRGKTRLRQFVTFATIAATVLVPLAAFAITRRVLG